MMVAVEGQSENFLEPFEDLFSIESPHSSLTEQTVVSLKPTITANSHQMFLLYSGVKSLHQKPSQLLIIQTLRLSVKFISNIFSFIWVHSATKQSLSVTERWKYQKMCNNWKPDASASEGIHLYIIHSLFLSLSLSFCLLKTFHRGGSYQSLLCSLGICH